MLVLSRRADECIVINGNIRVKILNIKAGRVRLGIDAPSDVHIDREEIAAARNQFAVPAGETASVWNFQSCSTNLS